MRYRTYSFQDVITAFSCPSVGNASSTGAGIGTIAIDMATEKTVHNVAADGTIMITKVMGDNGTVAIAMQQTSLLHKYLLKWYNYIDNENADLNDWASMIITISSAGLGDVTTCTGVSPQKLAARPYQAQGQMVTWTFMCAEISEG